MIGTTLSHYKIIAKLGEGGMGKVYRAEDTKLGRAVAIKVLPEELASDPERLERLEREARALAALDHPNIVTLHSVEEADGVHFLTMALVEGRTLGSLIPPEGLPTEGLLNLAIPLVDAVRAAHERGVVHRDLKPSNVMVDEEGRLRVLDFGLAKLTGRAELEDASQLPTEAMTQEGAVLGTYPYMSPEQVEGRPVDERSDIFALGVVLHEMATGRRPFDGETSASLVAAILRQDPPAVDELRPELPHHLGRIVRRCLEKDQERRYQRARDLLQELEGLRREVVGETHSSSVASAARAHTRQRLGGYAAAVLVVVAASLGGYFFAKDRIRPKGSPASAIRSVAVLPLTNLMNDPEQEYFVDGMTEALITDLAKLGDLEVISRTSVMHYKGTDKTAPEIARELDVDALLEGSVLRAGDQVRITAQLIDGETDTHLWVETYDRSLTNILELHSEVARAVAERVQLEISPGEEELLTEVRPVDPRAYEAYLKGMFHMELFTPRSLQQAAEYLERALELDPDFAEAHVGMARLRGNLAAFGLVPPIDVEPLARQSALRALEIDESSADAHTSLAFLHVTYDLDFPAARREVEIALSLDPSSARAHWIYAGYFWVGGELDRALREIRTASRLDPLNAFFYVGEAHNLVLLGRNEEALDPLERALDLSPEMSWANIVLSEALFRLGREEEAMKAVQASYGWLPELADAVEERYRTGGVEAAFREAARRMEGFAAEGWFPPWTIASAYARGGESDKALEWLERAVEVRSAYLWWLRRDPTLESLHSDPRFNELTRKLGLPE